MRSVSRELEYIKNGKSRIEDIVKASKDDELQKSDEDRRIREREQQVC